MKDADNEEEVNHSLIIERLNHFLAKARKLHKILKFDNSELGQT
jgi:hypothetical protein